MVYYMFNRSFLCYFTGMYIALGLSGVIPAFHFVITDGFYHAVNYASLGWLVLMAVLYIVGALIYAFRVPERIFPGKFDIWVGIYIIEIWKGKIVLRGGSCLWFLTPLSTMVQLYHGGQF
jgi:predicted membrane channel-forming protein YqfA (hemolysin III family)